MGDYLAQKGIEHHISLPYVHQQQGVAERTNRTLMTKVRALMKQSKLPPIYWTYAMHHAVRDLMNQKITSARDVIFYECLFLEQFREHEQANANRVYANNGHSYATPEDEAAAAILELDIRGEFTRGDRRSSDDDDDSPRAGAGAASGSRSSRGAAPPAPPEPESDNDDVQEVILQHRHDSTVFRVKTAADGTIEQFKARWVVHGYDQRHGIELDQTFAPVSRHTSVKILLAITSARHLPLRQIDVKNAFLYALVDDVIYVEQPHTPDLSYIASQLAQYSRKPTAENFLDLQRALQLFISTPNVGLCYSTIPTASFNLIGYVDADHAADPDNRRSRTGFLFRLEPSCPISWNSQIQELVALSSAEAEIIAATAAVCEGLYLQELLQEAEIPTSPNFRLHCDNQSAITIANKP
ncbi:unnamed protein product [Closterium sp. NIES-53]